MTNRWNTDWTEAEIERLREAWAIGKSAAAIGREMHRTKNAIIGMMGRIGLRNIQPPPRENSAPPVPPRPQPLPPGARTLPPLPSEMNRGK